MISDIHLDFVGALENIDLDVEMKLIHSLDDRLSPILVLVPTRKEGFSAASLTSAVRGCCFFFFFFFNISINGIRALPMRASITPAIVYLGEQLRINPAALYELKSNFPVRDRAPHRVEIEGWDKIYFSAYEFPLDMTSRNVPCCSWSSSHELWKFPRCQMRCKLSRLARNGFRHPLE